MNNAEFNTSRSTMVIQRNGNGSIYLEHEEGKSPEPEGKLMKVQIMLAETVTWAVVVDRGIVVCLTLFLYS